MITSTKNYTKKKDRQNPRTNGKSKAVQTESHKEAYTYILPEQFSNVGKSSATPPCRWGFR